MCVSTWGTAEKKLNICLGLFYIISQNSISYQKFLHDAKFIVSRGFVIFTLYMKLS